MVHIAEDSIDIQVVGAELAKWHAHGIPQIGVWAEPLNQDGDGIVLGRATIPVLRPSLRHVLEFAGLVVVFGADNGGDRLVVGDTTGSVGAVAEEVGVEDVGADGDDGGEREVVEVRVVLLREV